MNDFDVPFKSEDEIPICKCYWCKSGAADRFVGVDSGTAAASFVSCQQKVCRGALKACAEQWISRALRLNIA